MDEYYAGGDLDGIFNIESAEDCQAECQKNSVCKYWTYRDQHKDCYLKSEEEQLVSAASHYSGPRYCTEGKTW